MSFERLLLQKRRPRHLGYIRPVFSPYPWEKAQFIKCFPFRYEYLILDPQNPQKKKNPSVPRHIWNPNTGETKQEDSWG